MSNKRIIFAFHPEADRTLKSKKPIPTLLREVTEFAIQLLYVRFGVSETIGDATIAGALRSLDPKVDEKILGLCAHAERITFFLGKKKGDSGYVIAINWFGAGKGILLAGLAIDISPDDMPVCEWSE